MEFVENTLQEPVDDVLAKPLFCFLGTVSRDGDPRISPLWYLWEDDSIWIIADSDRTYTTRIDRHPPAALAVVDFEVTTGRVVHIGMRGQGRLVPLEQDRVDRLLRRYLGAQKESWDPAFIDLDPDRWQFIRFDPETIVARDQSFSPSLDSQPR